MRVANWCFPCHQDGPKFQKCLCLVCGQFHDHPWKFWIKILALTISSYRKFLPKFFQNVLVSLGVRWCAIRKWWFFHNDYDYCFPFLFSRNMRWCCQDDLLYCNLMEITKIDWENWLRNLKQRPNLLSKVCKSMMTCVDVLVLAQIC